LIAREHAGESTVPKRSSGFGPYVPAVISMRTGNSIGPKSATENTTVGMPLEAGTLCAASFQKIYTLLTTRDPKIGDHYRCVGAHFEQVQGLWDDICAGVYGRWRPLSVSTVPPTEPYPGSDLR